MAWRRKPADNNTRVFDGENTPQKRQDLRGISALRELVLDLKQEYTWNNKIIFSQKMSENCISGNFLIIQLWREIAVLKNIQVFWGLFPLYNAPFKFNHIRVYLENVKKKQVAF